MNSFNPNGRPPKKLSERKAYRANVKMSTEEYYTLKSKAKESGVTISEYIRLSISNTVINQRLTPEHCDLIRKVAGLANNFNQVTRALNTVGYIDARQEYLFLADKIDTLLNQILR